MPARTYSPELQSPETLLTLLLRKRASATRYSAGCWGPFLLNEEFWDNKGMEPPVNGEKPL